MTESADLESASDFVAGCFQAEDLNQIRTIFVQVSVEAKFIQLLKAKLKPLNTQSLNDAIVKQLREKMENYKKMGLEMIHAAHDHSLTSAIIKCPRSLIASDDLPIITLEVFRTTKEGISFAKAALSVNLWCENVSITYEYIHALSNARQIWMNSSHGITHPKVPFYNGQIICSDSETRQKAVADFAGSIIQVADHVHFHSTFRANTFQTVVIPFGETFAN